MISLFVSFNIFHSPNSFAVIAHRSNQKTIKEFNIFGWWWSGFIEFCGHCLNLWTVEEFHYIFIFAYFCFMALKPDFRALFGGFVFFCLELIIFIVGNKFEVIDFSYLWDFSFYEVINWCSFNDFSILKIYVTKYFISTGVLWPNMRTLILIYPYIPKHFDQQLWISWLVNQCNWRK